MEMQYIFFNLLTFLKMKIKSFLSLLLITASRLFTACEGPEGPEGPVGPAGPTGATGANGQNGKSGIKSFNFSINSDAWLQVSTYGQPDYKIYTYINIPELTEDILNTGMVLVYARGGQNNESNGNYIQLPYTNLTPTYNHVERFELATGAIAITHEDDDGLVGTPTLYEVKVVIAPREGLIRPDIDISDYAAVAEYLGLEVE
jgi:hypothetical protein